MRTFRLRGESAAPHPPAGCDTTHSQPERRTTEDTSSEFAYTTETGQSGQVSEDAGR